MCVPTSCYVEAKEAELAGNFADREWRCLHIKDEEGAWGVRERNMMS